MNKWLPIRKIVAAAMASAAAEGGAIYLFIAGVINFREFVALSVAVIAPTVAGYLTDNMPRALRSQGFLVTDDPGEPNPDSSPHTH